MVKRRNSEYMLSNNHADVTLSSVVYDPNENNLLVAAFTVATSVELLAAKAQLEKHGKNSLRAIDLAGSETIPLRGAGFGYVTVKCSLRSVNARGMVTVFLQSRH